MSAHIIGPGRWQGWCRPITSAAAALTLLSGLVLTGVGSPATAQASTPTPLGHIYWANVSGNTIGRADLNGTDVDQSFISGASLARSTSFAFCAAVAAPLNVTHALASWPFFS